MWAYCFSRVKRFSLFSFLRKGLCTFSFSVKEKGLAAARSPLGSDDHSGRHSLPRGRFATKKNAALLDQGGVLRCRLHGVLLSHARTPRVRTAHAREPRGARKLPRKPPIPTIHQGGTAPIASLITSMAFCTFPRIDDTSALPRMARKGSLV